MSLKDKLKNQELSLGSWITLAHPSIAEIMSSAGFDWLVVDLEHSSITVREAEEIIRIVDLNGIVPLVRLTSNDPDQIKRVMDSGAHGIIVPNITSLNELRNSYAALKYPPEGKRGVGLARAQKYGRGFESYLKWQKEESILIMQLENILVLDELEHIFSSNLIDAFILGPYDLSASMGIPGQFEDLEFLKVIEKIMQLADKFNITPGIHIVEPEPDVIKQRINEGHRFIAYSLDTRMLDKTCEEGLKIVNEE